MAQSRTSIFWSWYERHYALNLYVATGLFLLQLVHLYWLTMHVVYLRLFGMSAFTLSSFYQFLLIAVDYTEVPALFAMSLIYTNDLRKRFRWRGVFFLLFLNSQWLHLFWITDEFVMEQFTRHPASHGTILPVWLAWLALSIDYLELPVMVDTARRAITALRAANFRPMFTRVGRYYRWSDAQPDADPSNHSSEHNPSKYLFP